jgi:hypothetical protein
MDPDEDDDEVEEHDEDDEYEPRRLYWDLMEMLRIDNPSL